MSFSKRLLWLAGVLILCVGLDQISKLSVTGHLQLGEQHSYLGDTVRLQLTHNVGAFLGLGDSLSPAMRKAGLIVGVGCILVGILVYLMIGKGIDRTTFIALALIVAGGLSNLYDRIAYGGYVIDFLNFGFGSLRTGVLNIADIAITGGALVMLAAAWRTGKRSR